MTASQRDDNLLYLLIKAARRAWYSRPGYESIGRVLDTFDALGFETRAGQVPVMVHKVRTSSGWRLSFHLPAGISSADVLAKIGHFEEQAGGRIRTSVTGATFIMEISLGHLVRRVAFDWCPDEHAGMDVPVPIGVTADGPLAIDLAKLPHLFVGGNTGAGKTTFLRTATVALLHQPHVFVCVIDLKGLDFAFMQDRGLVVDTEAQASFLLASLNAELDRRRKKLRAAGATKLQEYQGDDLPWIVCVIDELAELREKDDQDALNRLGRLARAVGIHLVAATQRPSHTLFSRFTDLRMLFAARLAFAVPRPEDSRLLLDSDAAARIPANIPGRAIWRWQEEVEVQCYDMSHAEARRRVAQLPIKPQGGGDWYEQRHERLLPRPADRRRG